MLERDQPVDVLVVALLVERPVDGDAAKFQDIQAGESCGWQGRQDSLDGDAQGLVQWLRSLRGIERDCQNRTRSQLRRQSDFGFGRVRPRLKRRRHTVLIGSRFTRSDRAVNLIWSGLPRSNASCDAVG